MNEPFMLGGLFPLNINGEKGTKISFSITKIIGKTTLYVKIKLSIIYVVLRSGYGGDILDDQTVYALANLRWSYGIEAIKKGFGVYWLPRASSILTRFWGKIYIQSLSEILAVAARQLAITIIGWQGIGKDTLNLDSSVLIRYGNQEGAKMG